MSFESEIERGIKREREEAMEIANVQLHFGQCNSIYLSEYDFSEIYMMELYGMYIVPEANNSICMHTHELTHHSYDHIIYVCVHIRNA